MVRRNMLGVSRDKRWTLRTSSAVARSKDIATFCNIFASRENFMALPADPQAVRAPFAKTIRGSRTLARARLSVLEFGFSTKNKLSHTQQSGFSPKKKVDIPKHLYFQQNNTF